MKNVSIGGTILIIIGVIFFLDNFIEIDFPSININWDYVWPLILAAVGIRIIVKKKRREEDNVSEN